MIGWGVTQNLVAGAFRMIPNGPSVSNFESVREVKAEGRELPPGEQKQVAKLQKALAVLWSRPSTRPFFVGGFLGPLSLFLLSKLPDGFLWGPVEVPDVNPGVLLMLGSFAGSLVFGLVARLADIIAPTPLHYVSVVEAWLMYRQRQISRKQYYEYVAVRDYQRLYGAMPPELRPEPQKQFVRRAVRERMKPKSA